jgi:hypothetical protein
MSENPVAHWQALRRQWLPLEDDTPETWATALYLDRRHWENMNHAVAVGISKVF